MSTSRVITVIAIQEARDCMFPDLLEKNIGDRKSSEKCREDKRVLPEADYTRLQQVI